MVVGMGFLLLLVVGFDNVFAMIRSRVALALVIGPLILIFLWCIYKAFQPRNRLEDRPYRGKK